MNKPVFPAIINASSSSCLQAIKFNKVLEAFLFFEFPLGQRLKVCDASKSRVVVKQANYVW